MLLSQSSESSQGSPEQEPEVESKVHEGDEGKKVIEMNEPLNEDEKLIWQYLLTIMEDKRRAEHKNDNENDKNIDIEKEMQNMKLTFISEVFETSHGMTAKAFMINTLEDGKWVSQSVIDCWAAVLNYTEKKNNPKGKRRLRCYTTMIVTGIHAENEAATKKAFDTLKSHLKEVVECDNEMLKLKAVNIIIVLMIEKNHFYLICFDLDNKTVEVIDNVANSWFYKMISGTKIEDMGTQCKVKHYIVGYLKDVGHPKASQMADAKLTRKKLEWETTDNFNDCGVFAMRHMEMYGGSDVQFECGFSTRKDIQGTQLKNLRMKLATRVLLSESNVYRGHVLDRARETLHGMKDEEMQQMLNVESVK
ncbi:putative Ulp1 protease family catalytic domain, papain-like cysteine peptidase superfamily [Helianthus anomalus]